MPCTVSVLTGLTVADFKSTFYRRFNYITQTVPYWQSSTTYSLNDQVYYEVSKKVYKSLQAANTSVPTVASDWELQSSIDAFSFILDEDITRAYQDACREFPEHLFGTSTADQTALKDAYLNLSAHFLLLGITAGQGDSVGQVDVISSRSVDGVSESIDIGEWQRADGRAAFYSTTYYGRLFLLTIQNQALVRPTTRVLEGGTTLI